MEIESLLGSVISAVCGGGTVGGLVVWMVKNALSREAQDRKVLQAKVEQLEREKIGGLETQVKEVKDMVATHVEKDRSGEIVAKLDILGGMMTRFDDKLDRTTEKLAESSEKTAGVERYVGRLDTSLQNHKNDHNLHRG